MCGVKIILSSPSNFFAFSLLIGSTLKTSNAAPPILFSFSSLANEFSSIIPPLEVLMITEEFLISLNFFSSIKFLVSSVRGM